MRVLFATSEAYPFAFSGGLGDVSYALPKALRKRLIGCRVILPMYSNIPAELKAQMRFITHITVPVAWRNQYCGIFEAKWGGVTYILLDNAYYFNRAGMYGEYDDAERFAFFSRAVLEAIPHIDFWPDVIHCNDWQTALIPVYHKFFYYNRPGYENQKTMLTIHNIQYQGKYGTELLTDVLGIPVWAQSLMEYDGCVNILKGGIESANKITTVSPTYAEEILDPWYSHSLDSILTARKWKLCGIVNGIDTELYNPATDPYLFEKFSREDRAGKAVNKQKLQNMLDLPERADVPMVAMVSRLVSHKGFDLVEYIFDELMVSDIQFVLLGSGDRGYEEFFHQKSRQYPDKFAFRREFNTDLAHKIYAGADLFLMPSKSEPCGLAQMVALQYGTIPVVRKTGGLKDTIVDAADENGVGFTFGSYNAHDMEGALNRGLALYHDRQKWAELTDRAMQADNSWSKSASAYVKVYKDLVANG